MRLSRTAMMARPERLFTRVEDDDEGEDDQNHAGGEGGLPGDAAQAHGPADDQVTVLGQVGGVAEQAHVEAAAVHTHIEVVEDAP